MPKPSPAAPSVERFCREWLKDRLIPLDHILYGDLIIVAEAYAAAVSKNIREELVRLDEFRVAAETEVDLLEARAEKAEAHISELEQKLAELRNDSTKMFGKKIAQVKRAIRSKP